MEVINFDLIKQKLTDFKHSHILREVDNLEDEFEMLPLAQTSGHEHMFMRREDGTKMVGKMVKFSSL